MAVKIKVCGMKHPDNIAAVTALDIHYIGFIFYEKSKRFVGNTSREYIKGVKGVTKVGVFVNASLPEICHKIDEFNLNAVQLHGDESPQFCEELKQHTAVTVIKAFGIDQNFDWSVLDAYVGAVDFFLFDTKSSSYGGTGMRFDWSLLHQYKLERPYFLSGGLDVDSVEDALQANDPRLYALDLNSKFEVEPGLKDIDLLARSINSIKK
ncbi:MAG: N-(5-phosphoribosyl)anthranilate isomerase [Sphingobacterium sp.]|jgi:phosphoribosylanthranilate isomerase|uniref:phosphoribosylanthranilate isomerase n=1 Tax=unclassified Sphingobacterium TaxID=2609468 RepID=UPI000985BCFC|nr:phosphoribosylanthranilate isomerase [Sphingobacterium sp. CZ-UAM]MDF2517851.1 N-(5-phosphoribosyl)anthranilate isomerase [Sphingobacterium sp.]OOG16776.1 N-(5'-phosphoribosyl)anthranilate isomerase [Sphingobacterium sp. CZ-UAM]